jgi:hypothetical protein
MARAVDASGVDSSAMQRLASLVEGEISPGEWMARVRRAERERRAA